MTDTISVGGTMFDDAILSQPPTPQNLVEVLGWELQHDSAMSQVSDDDVNPEPVYIRVFSDGWMSIASDVDVVRFNAPSTLRDVVDLCRLLGIPCEVRR